MGGGEFQYVLTTPLNNLLLITKILAQYFKIKKWNHFWGLSFFKSKKNCIPKLLYLFESVK
jgi:hypothetical protein